MNTELAPSSLSTPESPPEVQPDPSLRIMRMIVSADALLPLSDAARILHGRESDNRRWIQDYVDAVHSPSGKALYRWADIVAALTGDANRRRAA